MSPVPDLTDYAQCYKLLLSFNVHLLCFIRQEMIIIAQAIIAFIEFDHMKTIDEGCQYGVTNFIQKALSIPAKAKNLWEEWLKVDTL